MLVLLSEVDLDVVVEIEFLKQPHNALTARLVQPMSYVSILRTATSSETLCGSRVPALELRATAGLA